MSKKVWTNDDDKFLKKFYRKGAKICACVLNTSLSAVYNRSHFLGLSGTFQKRFTDSEIQYVRNHFRTMSYAEIGSILGRSDDTIKNFCFRNGMKRSPQEAKLIQDRCTSITRFKPGNMPHNTREDFEIYTRSPHRGITYKFIKIANGKPVMLHIHEYEKVNGPVPEGMILRSKSGDTLDCSPGNWEPISRQEHLHKNSTGRINLEDRYIATILSRKNTKLRKALIEMPEILELKRNQLKLKRTLNELKETATVN